MFAVKLNLEGLVARLKACFIAKGYARTQSFKRRKRKARRFCVREARRKPRGVKA